MDRPATRSRARPLAAALAALALTSIAAGRAPFPSETLSELRQAVDAALLDGLEVAELELLAARWDLVLAEATSPGEVASVALLARALCAAGPPQAVAPLRARALRALVEKAGGSGRARRMLTADFLPRLEQIPPSEHGLEVQHYDALLRELASSTQEPATRAALEHAAIHLRLEVARTWDSPWLDAEERKRTLEALDTLVAAHGALDGPTGTDYAELARRARADFTGAAFGSIPTALAGPGLAGERIDLADARGEVVLVVFWSSWCIPCLEAVPDERALVEALRGQPFRLLGVCADERAAEGSAAAARTGMTWPSFFDGPAGGEGTGTIAGALGVRAWPSAFVFDRQGRLRFKFLSTAFRPRWTSAEVEAAVRSLLQETTR